MKIKLIIAIPLILVTAIVGFFTLPWLFIFIFGQLEPNPPKPENTYGEFPFRLVYVIDGEMKVIEDTLICEFNGFGWDEGNGKHIKWEARLANGNKLASFLFTEDYQYGVKLFDGFIKGQGGTSIIFDIGNPQYYLGYKNYTDYSPGRVSISSPLATGVINEDELSNKYNIKIIEMKFSQPLVGNGISDDDSSPHRDTDTARLSVKGVTVTPQESNYPSKTKQIVFILKNNTDKQLLCEQSFYIQKKINGKWEDVYSEVAIGFSQEQISLEPHTQITRIYDISKYTNDIPIGQYRVISPVLVPVKKNTYDVESLSGEFTIEG
ncbi:hypothetical protein M3194_00120 [Paenibacillus glycanilyticus]|uniref:immunoglobulin-like domain-containing protein n=1 Tax=Paenibacillus glycanilyticus TaxID=126569 RepID=UPI00203DAB6C|nr:immunoglobulin-like domain-containing protein [Paenibacillus glycanilyticus]MCM3625764.1 hypothetical protein [Paenibacillus glycanilyticus]